MQETRSVLGVICSSYDTFFQAEKKIADYIKENKAQVVEMTVGQLARASGVSDATVSRFCRRCGFKGFHSLKLALAREVLEEQQQDGSISNDVSRRDLSQSLQNILANKVAELTETVAMMDPDKLEQILQHLEQASTVYFAAVGNTIPVAMDAAFKMNQLGIRAFASQIWETMAASVFNLGPEDVVVIISNSGRSARLMTLAQGARENGCVLIVITNNPKSDLALEADFVLITATREKLLTREFWFSRVAATAVIEILYLLILSGSEKRARSVVRLEQAIMPDKQQRGEKI